MGIEYVRREIEDNYQTARFVSDGILDGKIALPLQITQTLGEGAKRPYYLEEALFRDIRRRRRDGKPFQLHAYDSAAGVNARFDDSILPSRFRTTPREIDGLLVHDLGEDRGKSPLGALVVNDVIRYLLGNTTGDDAQLLTKDKMVLLQSLESRIKELEPIDEKSVRELLERERDAVKISYKKIREQYEGVVTSLERFRRYVTDKVDHVPPTEKNEIVDGLSREASKQLSRREIVSPEYARHLIQVQFDSILEIMARGDYLKIREGFLLPNDPEFWLILEKTVYGKCIDETVDSVKRSVVKISGNGGITDDSYLSPMIMSLVDSTDSASKLDNLLPHALSIHRKSRAKIERGIGLVDQLNRSGVDYSRLQRAVDYLYRKLDSGINMYHTYLERKVQEESSVGQDLEKFEFMKERMTELGGRVERMNMLGSADESRRAMMGNVVSILLGALGIRKK